MQGRRNDVAPHEMEPGDYGRWRNKWWCRVPIMDDERIWGGNLSAHEVVEKEDGTITVSPSILISDSNGERWHGYLENGIWREV